MKWRRLGFAVLVTVVFLLPYAQKPWWQYFHTTIVLLALWGLRWGKEGMVRLGLGLRLRDAGIVLVAFPGVWFLSRLLLLAVARSEGVVRASFAFPENVDPLYQALNEELLLGFLFLTALRRYLRNPHLLAGAVAVAFALAHVVFYRWLSVHQTWLAPAGVLAVAFVGLARNYLILLGGHVGFAWVLHAGWNLTFLGGAWSRAGVRVSEPDLFGLFLGNPLVLAMAAGLGLLGAAAMAWCGPHPRFGRG